MKNWLKKLTVPLIILFFLAALAFVIFAVFFNRAELIVTSAAPFTVSVLNQRDQDCPASPCSLILAPGSYSINVSKAGFQNYSDSIVLKLGDHLQKNFQLQSQPSVQPLDANSPEAQALLKEPYADQIAALPQNNSYFLAPDSATVYFLADNPTTYLPTLYRKKLDQNNTAPEPLINLMRKIDKPLISINPAETMVTILDQTSPESANLYLLDLVKKSRTLVEQDSLISDLLWLPAEGEKQNFLVERINSQTMQPGLYLVDAANTVNQTALQIQTRLSAVWPLNSQEILYAESLNPGDLTGTSAAGFTVKDLNLTTQLSRDIFTVDNKNVPQKMKFESKNKILLMLIDGAVYSLSPIL